MRSLSQVYDIPAYAEVPTFAMTFLRVRALCPAPGRARRPVRLVREAAGADGVAAAALQADGDDARAARNHAPLPGPARAVAAAAGLHRPQLARRRLVQQLRPGALLPHVSAHMCRSGCPAPPPHCKGLDCRSCKGLEFTAELYAVTCPALGVLLHLALKVPNGVNAASHLVCEQRLDRVAGHCGHGKDGLSAPAALGVQSRDS